MAQLILKPNQVLLWQARSNY